jgi:hypothetical protein
LCGVPQVYPGDKRFEKEEEQDAFVHQWLVDAGMPDESKKIRLVFYKGRYHKVQIRACVGAHCPELASTAKCMRCVYCICL